MIYLVGVVGLVLLLWGGDRIVNSAVTLAQRLGVSTLCTGQAASMGAILLAGGAKGKRYGLPHSRVMIHQPLGGFQGQATDFEIHAREILAVRARLNRLLAMHTGKDEAVIDRDTERDNFMSAEESVEYGIIDQVLASRADPEAEDSSD